MNTLSRFSLSIALGVLGAPALWAQAELFVNGGFEDGTFDGWTIDYGYYQGNGIIDWDQQPHGLHAIIGPGMFQPGQTFPVNPYDGNWMARINDIVGNNHATRLTQTDTVTQEHLDEGGILYVQWGAMLVDPQHPVSAQPFFRVEVLQNGNILGQFEANATDAANQGWTNAGNSGGTLWYKADVYSVDISTLAVGDLVTVRLFVADCAFGGHGAFAFLDGIGTTPPSQSIVLTPNSAQTPIGTEHSLTATVADAFANPVVGTNVTFTVTAGPHAGTTATDVTDAKGQATFVYTGTIPGIDTIEGCFLDGAMVLTCDGATAEWVDECSAARLTVELPSPDGPGGQFGRWVDIDGEFIVVGSSSVSSQDLAYVYQRDDGGTPGMFHDDVWSLAARLNAPPVTEATGVAIEGDTVVISRPSSLVVFVRPATGWQDTSTPAAVLTAAHNFGQRVGISGDVIVAGGTQEAASVFLKPVGGWATTSVPSAVLRASDGTGGQGFGTYSAIDGDVIVAGAYQDHQVTEFSYRGSAYIFVKPAGGWSGDRYEQAKLIPSGTPGGIAFGAGVAIDGDIVLVAAVVGGPAYLFEKPSGGWSGTLTENHQLTSSLPGVGRFGEYPALEGGVALLGSSVEKVFYYASPGGWTSMTETAILTPDDNVPGDYFGWSNALSQGTVIIGARNHDGAGAAYIFDRGETTLPIVDCPADITVFDTKGSPPGETVYFTASATDNCDPLPTVTFDPPSGSLFPRGTTLVTCTAMDASGNQSVCTFPVVVRQTILPRKL